MNLKRGKKSVDLSLYKNEQVTLKFLQSEYDIARKSWGYYVTPSLQKRCKSNSLNGAIIFNKKNNQTNFVLVNSKKKTLFKRYLDNNDYKIITWVNDNKKFKKFFE